MRNENQPNQRLLQAVRELNLTAALAQVDKDTTDLVLGLLEQATTLLPRTRDSLPRKQFEAAAKAREAGYEPWVAGEFNPTVPELPLRFSDERVECTWTAGALDEGPPGFLHGGLSAYIMDVLSGVLIQSLGKRAVTGTLDLKYLRAIPLYQELEMSAWVERVDGRKLHVHGKIAVDGQKAVESRGLFVELLPNSHLTASALKG